MAPRGLPRVRGWKAEGLAQPVPRSSQLRGVHGAHLHLRRRAAEGDSKSWPCDGSADRPWRRARRFLDGRTAAESPPGGPSAQALMAGAGKGVVALGTRRGRVGFRLPPSPGREGRGGSSAPFCMCVGPACASVGVRGRREHGGMHVWARGAHAALCSGWPRADMTFRPGRVLWSDRACI